MCLKGWAPPELNPKMSREKISRNALFRFDARLFRESWEKTLCWHPEEVELACMG